MDQRDFAFDKGCFGGREDKISNLTDYDFLVLTLLSPGGIPSEGDGAWGGGGDCHIKRTEVLVENFENNPLEISRSCLWEWPGIFHL